MKVNKLEGARCKFCGAENNEKYSHIALYKTEDMDYFVKCDNCSAITPKFYSSIAAMDYWRAGDYTIHHHGEANIYEGCVALMQGLVDEFKEWIDFMGIEVPDENPFCLYMHPTEIVNRLFLYHTHHSGGTSTRAKCRELGIDDPSRSIEFTTEEEGE